MSKQFFAFMLFIIAVSELAVMTMFKPLFADLMPLFAGILDAGLLALIFAPPLWVLCSQLPVRQSGAQKIRLQRRLLFSKLLAVVCLSEFIVMFSLFRFAPRLTGVGLALVDAILTALLVLPLLWRFMTKFAERNGKPKLADVISTPIILFTTVLYIVFLADIIQELVQPYLTPRGLDSYFVLIDSILTTAIIAPFLWLALGKSLVAAAQVEKSRARTILDQVVDAVVTLDSDGSICSMNPAAGKIFGFNVEELVGESVNVLFLDTHLNIPSKLKSPDKDKNGKREVFFRGVNCRNKAGSTLIMDVSLSRILQHEHEEWLLILHDISQHKEAERALRERDERFRQIFEQADDAIAFFRPNSLRVIDVNETFANLFGMSKTEIVTHDLNCLIAAEDFPRVSKAIISAGQGHSARLANFAGRRVDGEEFRLSMRCKLMIIDNVGIVFSSFRDITKRIRLEQEAKDIQAKLIQTNKMTSLGLMVSGVAHEINNPNNFILANSRLLTSIWDDALKILREYYQENGDYCLGGIPFPELEKHAPTLLAGISEGAGRISEIVTSLKSFYRAETRNDCSVDINQVASSAVSLLHHELVNFTKNFHMQLVEDLPPVSGNGQQLGQVVINLLMNACQALPDNDCGVWLETCYDAQQRQVMLTVRDEGRGMPPEDSLRIMEPFFTTKLDEGGTGLGLTICRSIVSEHRGTLEFDSKPGKGTTFKVCLPAEEPAAKD